MGKDVTLKEGDDLVFPRTFARNVFLDSESLETILAAVEARLKALEENGVVVNPETAPTEKLSKLEINGTTYEVESGIEIVRED